MPTFQPRFRDDTLDTFLGYAQDAQANQVDPLLNQHLRPGWMNAGGSGWGQTQMQGGAGYQVREQPSSGWGDPGAQPGNQQGGTSYGSWMNPYGSFWQRRRQPQLGAPQPQSQGYGHAGPPPAFTYQRY